MSELQQLQRRSPQNPATKARTNLYQARSAASAVSFKSVPTTGSAATWATGSSSQGAQPHVLEACRELASYSPPCPGALYFAGQIKIKKSKGRLPACIGLFPCPVASELAAEEHVYGHVTIRHMVLYSYMWQINVNSCREDLI